MLKNKTYFLAGAMFFSLLGANAQKSMSLEQCITYALENHLSVKNANLQQSKAEQQIIETRSSGLPQVNGAVTFTNNVKVQSQFIPANGFDPTGDPNKTLPLAFGVAYSGNANVSLSQMLFNGSYFVGLEAAATYKELSQKQKIENEESVKVNVTKAYYGALVMQTRKDILLSNKEQIESLLKDTKIRYQEGFVEQIELTKQTVSLNNILTELENIDAAQKMSDNLLKMQMGMPFSEQIALSDKLESVLASVDLTVTPELNVNERKDYQVLETQLELADLNIRNYKVSRLPSAALFGTFGANNGTIQFAELPKFGDWRTYGYWGAQINVPIFSSFKSSSLITQKMIEKDILQNQIKLAQQGYEFEYQNLLDKFKNYQTSLNRQKENMQMAQEVYENSKIKFENGVGTNFEIVVAESSLKQAQDAYLGTVYDLLITKVDLEKTSGNLK